MDLSNSNPFEIISRARQLRLTSDYKIKPFNCGNNDLNDYLINDAKDHQSLLYSVTYLLESPEKTIAYYTVQNDKLKISPNYDKELKSALRKKTKLNNKLYNKMLTINEYPAVKISRFAIDIDFQNKGLGTFLLDTIAYSFINDNKTGCSLITVDAINSERTKRFYERNGFLFLENPIRKVDSILMYKNLISLI